MIKAIVVEDEILTLERICSLLLNTGRVEVIGGFSNPHLALEEIFLKRPDVIFLDIEMPEIDGLQLAEKIYESELRSEVIFITAYNSYAIDAFRVNALDYLLKPATEHDLDKAVTRAEKRISFGTTSQKTPKVRVSVLGGYSVWINGSDEPVRWVTAKCGELFAYFALQGPSVEVSKWKLIELLWPDKDNEKGDINLRSTLCRLNKTLREYYSGLRIASGRNSYYLKAEEIFADALILKELALSGKTVDAKSLSNYETAVASYKGQLLEDHDFEWSRDLQLAYQRYFTSLAKDLIRYYLVNHFAPDRSLIVLESLLKQDPFDEEAHLMMAKILYEKEGEVSARKYISEITAMFRAELGIEPGGSIREFMNKIK